MIRPQKFLATVVKTEKLTAKIYHLQFQLLTPAEIDFQPGQRCLFNIGIKRNNYSLCSSAGDKTRIEICVDTTPMGPGSQWITTRKVGDKVDFIGPVGTFQLKSTENSKIFLATGSGVSPLRSMMLDLLKRNFKGMVRLYFGLRQESYVFWQSEFDNFTKSFADFAYSIVLSQAGSSFQGKRGYIQQYLQTEILDKGLSDYEFYLCGNLSMITDVTSLLNQYKVVPDKKITEKFY